MIRHMLQEDRDVVLRIISEHSKDDFNLASDFYNKPHTNRHMDFVYEIRQKVVGVCSISPDSYNWPDILWISWFYVDINHRKQGIGSSLLSHAIQEVKVANTRKLYLSTDSHPSYQSAIRLYEKFGFVTEGVLKDYYEDNYHSIIMAKKLEE
jgi:ribosomal protein S18 acetylase RimI-like enzyme